MPALNSSVFIIFGEVFSGGYIQGLLAQARQNNATIIYSTMGRRDQSLKLIPLDSQEFSQKISELKLSNPKQLINIPLEAGFDLELFEGETLVDKINKYGLKNWEDFEIKESFVSAAKKIARQKFQIQIKKFLDQASAFITKDTKNIHFIHTMAGGIPRAKLLLAVLNKVLKGRDKRFYSSKKFCSTALGKISLESFKSVTAESFQDLLTQTQALRQDWEAKNISVTYSAFGYRGNKVLINDKYQWTAYAPYIQAWAKITLEDIAKNTTANACVFNCPEVLTRSSQAFSGIEVYLYPLLNSLNAKSSAVILKKIANIDEIKIILKDLNTKVLDQNAFVNYFTKDFCFTKLKRLTDQFFTHPSLSQQLDPLLWPQHNNPEQMHLMIEKTLELNKLIIEEKKLTLNKQLSAILIYLSGYHIYKKLNSKQAVHHLTHEILLS